MKRHNAKSKKFIRHLKHEWRLTRKFIHDSNNDRKRGHKPLIRTCYFKCKYEEIYGRKW